MRQVLLVFSLAACALAQTFEVASLKPATGDPGESAGHTRITASPGRLNARAANLLDMIEWAWELREYQVAGPDWIRSERFDLAAKTVQPASPKEMRPMLRALLAERFHLSAHFEKRPLPALALAPARGGPKLREDDTGSPGWNRVGPGLKLEFVSQSMAGLANFLSTLAVIDRPVVDASGMKGAYTFTLDLNEAVRPGEANPSVSTLLEEQLGLRLEGRRLPIDVLVIDRIEKGR